MDFGRVVTAMVTPFDDNLQVDWAKTEELIEYLIIEQQSDSLVITGTTGEASTLTDEEKIKLYQLAVKQAAGRCKIIAGSGSNDTAHSVHLTKEAEKAGVHGILLVAPYYNRPSQEGIYLHFKAIADSTSLPIMLYNIPKRTGVTISAETTIRLAQLSNVVATKEASGDLELITNVLRGVPAGFRVYSGDDELIVPILSIGGYGVVSVVSHVIGKQLHKMIDSFFEGRVHEAAQLHQQLLPTVKGLFVTSNPVPVKYALELHGMNVGSVRLPLAAITEEEKIVINSLFKG
ncbi:MAG: 4-hydroxy-tetrahydrodipicolinate synthase [Paenibacillaceae bacterium]